MINEKTREIIEEINLASQEIPFGNSDFQNINFVVKAELTTGRAYRACLLRLNDRLNALRENYYNLELEDIDIEEMEEKVKNENTDKFEKRRLLVKIEQKKVNRSYIKKLVDDAIIEVETLYKAFKQLPKITRKEFEQEEQKHYELKLTRDAQLAVSFGGVAGQIKSLEDMGGLDFYANIVKNKIDLSDEIKKIREEKLTFKEENL